MEDAGETAKEHLEYPSIDEYLILCFLIYDLLHFTKLKILEDIMKMIFLLCFLRIIFPKLLILHFLGTFLE